MTTSVNAGPVDLVGVWVTKDSRPAQGHCTHLQWATSSSAGSKDAFEAGHEEVPLQRSLVHLQ